MDTQINKALIAAVEHYASGDQQDISVFLPTLLTIFESDASFLDKVADMDQIVDEHPGFAELREPIFDLLLMNFFAADVTKLDADYLESPEWETIEEETIDRGTELLNLLLYLQECADEGITPELDDYLREFLLVDEDEFQDEHQIYEPIIAQPILVESSYEEIANAARRLPVDAPLSELFYALLGFFYEQDPAPEDLEEFANFAPNLPFDLAIYQLIVHYSR